MTATEEPSMLGPYILGRELGRGAFGVVYEGFHESRSDHRLAIKTVEGQGEADRLLLEPALLARLKHPCIVGLDDYFVHQGKLVLALEFVPGEDLKAWLDRGETFNPERVREFVTQIASALAEAHSHQIVHRDLKPSNVLVDTTGGRPRFVLTDFGIGRRAEGLQAEKHVGGTYLYMAPEQLRGRPGPQSDLWALGVVAYQMLTGKLPFPGPSIGELAKQIQYADPPPPSAVVSTPIPADLESVILGLLTKSLSERIASARQVLEQLGVHGDTKRILESTTETKRLTSKKQLPLGLKLARDSRRSKRLVGAMLVIYALIQNVVIGFLVLFGLWLFYRSQEKVRPLRRRLLWILAAFATLACAKILPSMFPEYTNLTIRSNDKTAVSREIKLWIASLGVVGSILVSSVVVGATVMAIFAPIIGSAAYVNLRRVRREQTLLNAALAGQAGSDEFLATVHGMIDTRFEDVGFHLRYAEMLYSRGDFRRAAVEARLITRQDPYHFNANLLLANAYYALGLYADCRTVCTEYLAVSGYCFEFQELRLQCDARLGPS
ncbi:MAG TPA: serine/threonine-protein kinase [Fimbriiglobus sp.]|jgi:serine/threonine-protein kinase